MVWSGFLLILCFFFCFFFHVGIRFIGIDLLFSIFLLCIIIDIVCCMAMVFISLNVCFIAFLGILSLSFRLFIQEMYIVALIPIVITISGSTFQ